MRIKFQKNLDSMENQKYDRCGFLIKNDKEEKRTLQQETFINKTGHYIASLSMN